MKERRTSFTKSFSFAARDNIGCGSRLSLTLVLLLGVACAQYAEGTFRYVDHPDLVAVEFASSDGDPRSTGIGMVSATKRGAGTCDEVAAAALEDLLAEAKAIGGQAVEEVQFRERRAWLGRVVCLDTSGEKTVKVRGVAVE